MSDDRSIHERQLEVLVSIRDFVIFAVFLLLMIAWSASSTYRLASAFVEHGLAQQFDVSTPSNPCSTARGSYSWCSGGAGWCSKWREERSHVLDNVILYFGTVFPKHRATSSMDFSRLDAN